MPDYFIEEYAGMAGCWQIVDKEGNLFDFCEGKFFGTKGEAKDFVERKKFCLFNRDNGCTIGVPMTFPSAVKAQKELKLQDPDLDLGIIPERDAQKPTNIILCQ